jgi:hypothetical protein
MKTYPGMEEALRDQADFLTQIMWAFHYDEIDRDELRLRMTRCAGVLDDLRRHAAGLREKAARGGLMAVTFDTEGPELAELFWAVPRLTDLIHNTESALGLVADHLSALDLDRDTAPASGHLSVLELAGQALRASLDADCDPLRRLHQKLVAAHVRHLEMRNASAEGVAE